MATNPPSAFICPISNDVMKDPVVDKEGNTYERSAIERWLNSNTTSPITRQPLCKEDLAPNRSLREAIEAWQSATGGAANANTDQADTTKKQESAVVVGLPNADTIDVDLKVYKDNASGDVLLQVVPPESPAGAREPIDVVCVVDISGSMAQTASVQNEKGERESHGLNILDVVKHAVATVGGVLDTNDRLGIVSFSNTAEVVMPLTSMGTDASRANANQKMQTMQPSSRTNIWDGLHKAMELLRNRGDSAGRNGTVMLLTDGQPNINPPRGIVPTLKRYLDEFPNGTPPFTLNTFGFGYDLDSALLNEVAQEGSGMYVFIPDSGLVGTVFVNCLANLQATCATSLTISVDSEKRSVSTLGPHLLKTQFGAHGKLGTLQYGQTRNVLFSLGGNDVAKPNEIVADDGEVFVKLDYTIRGVTKTMSATAVPANATTTGVWSLFSIHRARNSFISTVSTAVVTRDAKVIDDAVAVATPAAGTPLGDGLMGDLKGEVALALRKDSDFKRWGIHYLPSLVRANFLEQCNNFKDKSVQCYGGKFFDKLRDAGENTFLKIPPPKPSAPARQHYTPGFAATGGPAYGGARASAPSAPQSMAAYYNVGGGCVAGHCKVALAGGISRPAADVKRGDVLASGAVVRAHVMIRAADDLKMVTFPNGLQITEYHPIVGADGSWAFPADIAAAGNAKATMMNSNDGNKTQLYVHNFVLESANSKSAVDEEECSFYEVEGVKVASLGHGLTTNAVIAHEYLGTKKIVEDLSRLVGFDNQDGVVEVHSFLRNATSNQVCGIVGEFM